MNFRFIRPFPLLLSVGFIGVISCAGWSKLSQTQHKSAPAPTRHSQDDSWVHKRSESILRAIQTLAQNGDTLNRTSIVTGSPNRASKHSARLAFEVNTIDGLKVGAGSPSWGRCRKLGVTETCGSVDRGHSTSLYAVGPC